MPSASVCGGLRHVKFPAVLQHRIAAFSLITMLLGLAASFAKPALAAEPPRRPNILFILADDKYYHPCVNRENRRGTCRKDRTLVDCGVPLNPDELPWILTI